MGRYFKSIFDGIYSALIGMRITISHLFVSNVTIQYPNVKATEKSGGGNMPPNARNRLFMDIEDCNGCNGCVRACPVNCIVCDTVKVTPDQELKPLKSGGKRGLWVTHYSIDFAKCCFCSLCIEPCPTGTIRMTTEFEYSDYNRESFLYVFSDMSEEEATQKKAEYETFAAEKKKKAAEAKAKKAADAKAKAEVEAKEAPKEEAKAPEVKEASKEEAPEANEADSKTENEDK